MPKTTFIITNSSVSIESLYEEIDIDNAKLENSENDNAQITVSSDNKHLWILQDDTILSYADEKELQQYASLLGGKPQSAFVIERSRDEGAVGLLRLFVKALEGKYKIVIELEEGKICSPEAFYKLTENTT